MRKSTDTPKAAEDVMQLMADSYTTQEAARIMGLGLSRLTGMRTEGIGPAYLKAQSRVYYPKKWLHSYMQSWVQVVRPVLPPRRSRRVRQVETESDKQVA